jgi:hypothetical protein
MVPELWQQSNKTLQVALERPEDHRAGFLDERVRRTRLRKEVEYRDKGNGSERLWGPRFIGKQKATLHWGATGVIGRSIFFRLIR